MFLRGEGDQRPPQVRREGGGDQTPPQPTATEKLLTEIRDLLKEKVQASRERQRPRLCSGRSRSRLAKTRSLSAGGGSG